jgi:hypothetical protein
MYSMVSFSATLKVCVLSEQLPVPDVIVMPQVIAVAEPLWRTTNVVVSLPLLVVTIA